ncbi:hypothetical protein [Paractinoplanes durhamensis]|uniref:hypothetical protein n=1 Tax=Paractinoplanes durhamensis TaxID=113563 RepID=UPI003632979D
MVRTEARPLLLRPMLAVCERLRTSMRLLILVVVLVVPGALATAMYSVVRGNQIDFSMAEREGADAVRPMLLALADTVAGEEPDLAAVRRVATDQPGLGLAKVSRAMPELGDGSPARRLEVAGSLAAMITEAGNSSNLILDPDLDSFYVMDAQVVQLPKALMAAMSAANPAPGDSVQARLAARAVMAGNLASAADALGSDLDTAARSTELTGLKDRLDQVQSLQDEAASLAQTITTALASPSSADPAALGAAARVAVAPLYQALVDLLDSRIRTFNGERRLVLGAAIGGFLLAGWFAIAAVRGTTHDVRRTVRAVTAIAEGISGSGRCRTGATNWATSAAPSPSPEIDCSSRTTRSGPPRPLASSTSGQASSTSDRSRCSSASAPRTSSTSRPE